MTRCIFSYCCGIIILPLGSDPSVNFTYGEELYDGSRCTTEHGEPGICQKLMDCPPRVDDVLAKNRTGDAAGRCGFDGNIEIVCCPANSQRRTTLRTAEKACRKFKTDLVFTVNPIASICNDCLAEGGVRAVGVDGGRFPYMAALGYVEGDGEEPDPISYECSGSLISLEYILTTAHCVSNSQNRVPKWVRLGARDTRSTDAEMIPVSRTIPHPQYQRREIYHDIAIVKLQRPVRISWQTYPICLQTTVLRNSSIHPIASFITVGFRAMSPTDTSTSNKSMKSTNLNLVPVTTCNETYMNFPQIPHGIDDTIICAVEVNATRAWDDCEGDSGGPLIMITRTGPTLIGVTAFGQGCSTEKPTGYTSVFAHIDWIESTVWPEEMGSHKINPRNAASFSLNHVP